MDDDKLNLFVNKIRINKKIMFTLYNAIYIIKYINKKFIIKQLGLNISHTYDSITELFSNYMVYGSSLRDIFEDINIID